MIGSFGILGRIVLTSSSVAAHAGEGTREGTKEEVKTMEITVEATNSQQLGKRKISLKKIEANRRNALLSTGPSRPEGKNRVRWNALTHGLLAREIVIPAGEGTEDAGELQCLLGALRDDLRPNGALEEVLVEKIAVCYWRLRRVHRTEVGEIRRGLDTVNSALKAAWQVVRKKLGEDLEIATPERAWMESVRSCFNLPESAVVDKLIRYETTIERQLYRAMHQLERIQRRKAGEAVPSPVSVEFLGER